MLSFLDGRSVAVHSRVNSAWRSQLQSCTSSGRHDLDIDATVAHHDHQSPVSMESDSFDYGDEASYDMFSTPTDAVLYDVFQAPQSNIHSLRSLKLSTTRLTKAACELLGQLVFLESLELRLFESVATEWHRECLSSQQLAWNNPFNPILSSQSNEIFIDERDVSHMNYTSLHDTAINSFGHSLMKSLHKLCHLKSLTIVSFLDVSDDQDELYDDSTISVSYPVLREQCRAIIQAISSHPTLEQIVFLQPLLLHSTSSFHPKWLDTIPNLQSVQLIEPVSVYQSNRHDDDKKFFD